MAGRCFDSCEGPFKKGRLQPGGCARGVEREKKRSEREKKKQRRVEWRQCTAVHDALAAVQLPRWQSLPSEQWLQRPGAGAASRRHTPKEKPTPANDVAVSQQQRQWHCCQHTHSGRRRRGKRVGTRVAGGRMKGSRTYHDGLRCLKVGELEVSV